jgi:hypothetical protein
MPRIIYPLVSLLLLPADLFAATGVPEMPSFLVPLFMVTMVGAMLFLRHRIRR